MNGILLVDKPAGWTSHDVVDFIRRRFGIEKAGHAGTLDPLATGLLVILIGKATKLFSDFSGQDKEYKATLTLGIVTDTGDSQGEIMSSRQNIDISDEKIKSVFESFKGIGTQIPPMYSAVKRQGEKLYELARRGEVVERLPRRIEIKKIKISKIGLPDIAFDIVCSKGTYIRTLCEDIGRALGYGAHMSGLRRLRSGDFSLKQALSIEEIKKFTKKDIEERLIDADNPRNK